VFLRKKQPQIITDLEKYLVDKSLKTIKASYHYIVDIRGEIMTVFESHQNIVLVSYLTKTHGQKNINTFKVTESIEYKMIA